MLVGLWRSLPCCYACTRWQLKNLGRLWPQHLSASRLPLHPSINCQNYKPQNYHSKALSSSRYGWKLSDVLTKWEGLSVKLEIYFRKDTHKRLWGFTQLRVWRVRSNWLRVELMSTLPKFERLVWSQAVIPGFPHTFHHLWQPTTVSPFTSTCWFPISGATSFIRERCWNILHIPFSYSEHHTWITGRTLGSDGAAERQAKSK